MGEPFVGQSHLVRVCAEIDRVIALIGAIEETIEDLSLTPGPMPLSKRSTHSFQQVDLSQQSLSALVKVLELIASGSFASDEALSQEIRRCVPLRAMAIRLAALPEESHVQEHKHDLWV